ncbi:hypothetical protein CspHIS471_0100740 [Cutaneotrichosporon sp. HIS471]|nr:hypothetical protein CspHIS471_0100740 [Cutaneotrichosporon sp. HIS471]
MFGTTSREEIYGRRPSQTAKSPPAPLLAFRDFSKEATERSKTGTSPIATTSTPTSLSNAGAAMSPTHDKTDRLAHIAGSRGELYGRRPSLVGPDGRVPPSGKPEWVKGASGEAHPVFEENVFEEDDVKPEAKKA